MPCYTIQRTTIELGPKTNPDHLRAGMEALQLNPRRAGEYVYFNTGNYHAPTGRLTLNATGQDAETQANAIRRAYMTEATKATARKFGFQVKSTGAFKFDVVKATL